ncbi:MAG: DUF308 domain-containing protein [Halobacteriales archaeon]|nr:DUF308 domain-containing protein [Halobacteriales archaeon]
MSASLPPVAVIGRVIVGVIALALGLMILLWPGPFAPTDRIPFALLFLIPGVIALLQAKWIREEAQPDTEESD